MKARLCLTLLILSGLSILAGAQDKNGTQPQQTPVPAGRGMGRAMPPARGRGLGPAKGWGRGLGPGRGKGLAPGGRYFIDADKNGVCDTYEKTLKK